MCVLFYNWDYWNPITRWLLAALLNHTTFMFDHISTWAYAAKWAILRASILLKTLNDCIYLTTLRLCKPGKHRLIPENYNGEFFWCSCESFWFHPRCRWTRTELPHLDDFMCMVQIYTASQKCWTHRLTHRVFFLYIFTTFHSLDTDRRHQMYVAY